MAFINDSYSDDILAEIKAKRLQQKEEIRNQIKESKKNQNMKKDFDTKRDVRLKKKKTEYDQLKPRTRKRFKKHNQKVEENKIDYIRKELDHNDPMARKLSLITENLTNKSLVDEDWNPIDPVAYVEKVTWKTHGNTVNYSPKRWKVSENNRVYKKKQSHNFNPENLNEVCDREREYVHELQRILFSYLEYDIGKIQIALWKIDDEDWKIHELFEKEIWNWTAWRRDFFHWRETCDIEFIIDTVLSLHKWIEKVKEEINKKLKNPEDKLQRIFPYYNRIHWRSPRAKD